MTSSEDPPEPSPESASLLKRLAGPSVTKAGLANDQTDINRVIAEVSKGSKFYENEKKKDKDLTQRIAKILKLRDDMMKGANIGRIEAEVDRLLVELETQRDLSQYIVHVDMDAFYASVELMHNPDLVGKPFGVGKGVLTTASYEARKYGVRSGMAGFVAVKLCPEIILLPINFTRYSEMSRKVMAIFRQYDSDMLVAGITRYCQEHKLVPEDCVQQMRIRVQSETKLTVSAGIAPNKMLAKICSDRNKPNGQFLLPFNRQAILSFMRDLSIRKLPGVGRVNERLLESIGIKTCGDIYTHRTTISLMDKHFGLKFLLRAYLGTGSNIVRPHQREERKSIGSERTFHPIDNQQRILRKLEEVAAELEDDMGKHGWAGKTITLKYKLDTYQVFTRAKSSNHWVTNKDELFNIGKDLLKNEFPLKLRLIGLRATKLKDLRASEDQGIRRFFANEGHSPTKRQNAPSTDDLAMEDDEVMPGFREHDEECDDASNHDEETDGWESFDPGSTDKAIYDQSSTSSKKPPSSSSTSTKPRSRTQHTTNGQPPSNSTRKVQLCPICSKEVESDNSALNEHIDFCLSKGAIMQATATSLGKRKSDSRELHQDQRLRR